MGHFIKASKVSRYNMRMVTENLRIPMMLLIIALYLIEKLSSISTFCEVVNIDVTPFAFIFLVNNYSVQFVIAACAVVIFCNAPYEDESYQYMITRTGRLSWGLGQVLYIIKMSCIYVFCLIVASVLPFVNKLQLTNEWGKIWGTLGKTDAGRQYGIELSVSQNIMRDYDPINALVITILLEFACVMCIGFVIYLGNKITNQSIGTVIGALITVLDICIANDWLDWAYGFSPVSLAQINTFYGYASKWGINLSYAGKFFVISLLWLSVLCIVANYKDKFWSRLENVRIARRNVRETQ